MTTIPETATRPLFLAASPECGAGAVADVLICGVPWDDGSSFRPGAAGGPAAVRIASHVLEEYSLAAGADIRELRIVDAGDWRRRATGAPGQVEPSTGLLGGPPDHAATAQAIADWLAHLASAKLAQHGLLVVLGGDHLVTVPAVAALVRLRDKTIGPLAALILDAHADLRPEYEGHIWSHACVTHLLKSEAIPGAGRIQAAGVRSATAEELAAAREDGQAWALRGAPEPNSLQDEALAALGALPPACPIYLSVDIDVADPAAAGGVGAPEPGGVSARELIQAVRAVARAAGPRLIGLDVVEVSPGHDPGGATATLAAKVVREVIAERAAALVGRVPDSKP